MEVAKKTGKRYPAKTIYGIVCGIRRHLEEKNGTEALNPLDNSDRRFTLFRRALDTELKDATREGLHVKNKKEEKESVTEEEEELFWNLNLLGMSTAKPLLNTVYFYNGKLFGLRGGEHRSLVLTNFEVGFNFVKFEENSCKTTQMKNMFHLR
ncbi:zinc finger MYM-type protein 3-like [Montipora capricornis]|uniref:zinc finger MYM-type protein 3-like n=1 Tax=Montipora capricornis TaxID=246305 RepID=UPI0035F1D4C0